MDNSWTKKTNKFLKSQIFDIWGLKVCEFVHFCMCEFVYVRIMGVTNYPINPVKTCTNYGYFTVIRAHESVYVSLDFLKMGLTMIFEHKIKSKKQQQNKCVHELCVSRIIQSEQVKTCTNYG